MVNIYFEAVKVQQFVEGKQQSHSELTQREVVLLYNEVVDWTDYMWRTLKMTDKRMSET